MGQKTIFFAILAIAFAIATSGLAQTDTANVWKESVDFNLGLTQNAYSDSWTGGEAGNASWMAGLNSIFEGPLSGRFTSKSTFRFSFGQTHIQDEQTKHWKKPVKSTDLIDIESILRYRTGWFVNPFLAGRFESQFIDASVDSIKRYVNPIRLTESVGFTRRFFERGKEFIDSRFGLAMREIIDRRIVDTSEKKLDTRTTTDGGLESVTDLSLKLHQNVLLTSKLSIYKAFTVSDRSIAYWASPDFNWENILSASVTKYVTVNLYMQWLYDKQIDWRGRFKETLSLGLVYKLI